MGRMEELWILSIQLTALSCSKLTCLPPSIKIPVAISQQHHLRTTSSKMLRKPQHSVITLPWWNAGGPQRIHLTRPRFLPPAEQESSLQREAQPTPSAEMILVQFGGRTLLKLACKAENHPGFPWTISLLDLRGILTLP